jgi:excisionase family DNA binding protein
MKRPPPPDEMTPAQVAAELGVSGPTVRRWAASGILKPARLLPGSGPGHRHRRYSRATVAELKARLDTELASK